MMISMAKSLGKVGREYIFHHSRKYPSFCQARSSSNIPQQMYSPRTGAWEFLQSYHYKEYSYNLLCALIFYSTYSWCWLCHEEVNKRRICVWVVLHISRDALNKLWVWQGPIKALYILIQELVECCIVCLHLSAPVFTSSVAISVVRVKNCWWAWVDNGLWNKSSKCSKSITCWRDTAGFVQKEKSSG